MKHWEVKMTRYEIPLLVLLLLAPTLMKGNPLTIFEAISRFYRQGNRYDEGHPRDSSGNTILKEKEYDFIVVGAGVAGSVVANRLTEVPDWTVLLLEAGSDENVLTDIPVFVGYFQLTNYNWGFRAQPQDNACLAMTDRRCNWPRGKALGGTSVINYMIYTRGNRIDFDMWAELGNHGWSYDEVLPYFKKSENNLIPEYQHSPYHGKGGYLNVERVPFKTPLVRAFLAAGQELGYPVTDFNGESQYGFSFLQATQRNGTRCSAAKAFLRPVRNRKNLHIAQRAHVTRILIDPVTRRAYGVQFVKNKRLHTIRARKEVILSAGSLSSPQLLMLAGVGPRDHLAELGIPVLQDLKVGHNLQEHVAYIGLTFLVNQTVSLVESRLQTLPMAKEYAFKGTGPLTIAGGTEGLAYVKTPLHGQDGNQAPDIEIIHASGSLNSDGGGPIRRGLGITDEYYNSVFRSIDNRDAFALWPLLMHPKSRGVLRLKSKNPFHWPLFYPNFFSDPRDMEVLVEGIKIAVAVGQSEAFARYGARLHDTPVPGCVHHPFGSDSYWACAARHFTGTLHHQVGTCKMGPHTDPDAVVDPELKVYGIEGLRVIDASIMPLLPTCHSTAATYMIGEKGSDLIKRTYGKLF